MTHVLTSLVKLFTKIDIFHIFITLFKDDLTWLIILYILVWFNIEKRDLVLFIKVKYIYVKSHIIKIGFIPSWLRLGPWAMIFFISYEQVTPFLHKFILKMISCLFQIVSKNVWEDLLLKINGVYVLYKLIKERKIEQSVVKQKKLNKNMLKL